MSRLVFVDTETTGLQPHYNEVWEIAVLDRHVIEHTAQPRQIVDVEHVFHIRPDLTKADPTALRINRYYERTAELDSYPGPVSRLGSVQWNIGPEGVSATASPPAGPRPGKGWDEPQYVARTLARLLDGAHLVGAVPSFDAAFLSRFLVKHGQAATWHYHLIDVEALAVGFLACGGAPPSLPWDSATVTAALGVKVDPDARHTALGDARWARDLYDAVMASSIRPPTAVPA